MDIYYYIEQQIYNLIDDVSNGIVVEPARNPNHGDIATNAPIILARHTGKTIKEIGEWLLEKIEQLPQVATAELALAGFINIRIKTDEWYQVIRDINQQGSDYGYNNLGNGQVIHIESVSANPTGPLHIGHARSAIFFSVLAKLLEKVGYKIVREYYINDAGAQIIALTDTAYARYQEALGHPIAVDTEIAYPGEYLQVIGQKLVEHYQDELTAGTAADKRKIKDFTIRKNLESIKEDLLLLGIKHDVFVSEESLHSKIQEAIDILSDKGLIYRGYLDDPKGERKDDWEAHEHLLFKSTEFGDDADRSLQKADGSWTYFAADIAYHLDKINRGFHNMILGLGLDHAGYVKRLEGAVMALSGDKAAKINIKLLNIVHLCEQGKPIKMSKRSGNFVTLRNLIEDVGSDVVKYMMLTRRHDVVLDIDLDQVRTESQNNPVFYVQYAHARACSVLRQVENYNHTEADLSLLSTATELGLIKVLAKWPRIVRGAAVSYEPHRITSYLQELGEAFHALWHFGNKSKSLRFLVPDDVELTYARCALVSAVKNTISSGLELLSITPRDSM